MIYSDTSHNIDIHVETAYLPEQSDPEKKRYVFSYHITITNRESQPVQLLRRRWLIIDGDEQAQEVEGEGVIGEQPIIEPEESYSYTSGTVLATRVGSMQGHYQMKTDDGQTFNADIEPFTLALPNALH
ncbi:Co2+/Mg2+ efflux protein ApaG [Amphritea sp. 1_MG-2023]|uniref:Co2+/Mg2+ efflux protein ApaG n=1 Tax=Amphritea sp. 1_MG-2023 TaxID=3062670 RepID=UPI0026E21CA1|nr:Co2+/Mg2+ efflux protein ApaG [Amphritea sp. 1_MG-2023]MDO6563975.1 Co2+/Mg2+ efflux protein ApaG [Amphritea sp. 1_MG-2023]